MTKLELLDEGICLRPPYGKPIMYNKTYQSVEFKLKIYIQNFDGHIGIEEFLDWLSSMETFFKL